MRILLDVLMHIVWLKNKVLLVCLEDQQSCRTSHSLSSQIKTLSHHSGFCLLVTRERKIRTSGLFYYGAILELFLQSGGLFGGHMHHAESNLQL